MRTGATLLRVGSPQASLLAAGLGVGKRKTKLRCPGRAPWLAGGPCSSPPTPRLRRAAGLQLRSSSYHALASRLRALAERLCGGRLVLLLEGGYDLRGLSEGVANSFLGLLGGAADDKFNPALLRDEPLDKARAVLAEARRLHGL